RCAPPGPTSDRMDSEKKRYTSSTPIGPDISTIWRKEKMLRSFWPILATTCGSTCSAPALRGYASFKSSMISEAERGPSNQAAWEAALETALIIEPGGVAVRGRLCAAAAATNEYSSLLSSTNLSWRNRPSIFLHSLREV